ncbi:NADPH2:quinone reductase, partial [Diplonema papillatum]
MQATHAMAPRLRALRFERTTRFGSFARVMVHAPGPIENMVFESAGGNLESLVSGAGPNTVVVRNAYAGVNFIDTYFRTGLYPKPAPFTLGMEGAGEIVDVGKGVDPNTMVGKSVVYWRSDSGSYAEYATVHCDELAILPDNADLKTSAAVALQGMTAHYLCHDVHDVKEGDAVLVHAAAGGCGLLLAQMCKVKGAMVIGTCSTEEKAEVAKNVGRCDHVIVGYEDFDVKVRALRPDGVDACFDGVGKDTFQGSLRSIRRRGTMASFGNASGAVPPLSILDLTAHGSILLSRPTLFDFVRTEHERRRRYNDVMDWVASGMLSLTIDHVYPLSEVHAAHT